MRSRRGAEIADMAGATTSFFCPAGASLMSRSADVFWRQVGTVLAGTALAQAIPLAGSLLIARLYAPAEFGMFAAWLGGAHLAAVALSGRFELALALEPEGAPRRVAAVATLVVVLILAWPLAALAAVLALAGGFDDVPAALWWLLVPTAMAIAAAQTWQSWAAADGRLGDLSRLRVGQAAAVTGAQVLAGVWWPSAPALAGAHLVGLVLGLLLAWQALPLRRADMGSGAALRAEVRSFWSRRRRFPMLSLPADSVNSAAAQLPLLIIGSRFGAEMAGLLALTLRVLAVPIALLGSSVLDVFRRRSAASWRAQGHCREDFDRTFKVLALGSLAAAVPVALFAEPLFALAFGERWRLSGTIALWLLPLFALRFVASPLSYLFYVAGKQHVDLLWQCGLLALTLATLWLPSSASSALLAYSAGYSAMYAVYLWLSYRYSRGVRA